MDTSAHRWEEVLAQLEEETSRVESLLDITDGTEQTAATQWSPPTDLGPLPTELEHRARQILDRQHAAATRLTEQMAAVRDQQNLAARVSNATSPDQSRPVYLDLDA
jgi:hypothetical protein